MSFSITVSISAMDIPNTSYRDFLALLIPKAVRNKTLAGDQIYSILTFRWKRNFSPSASVSSVFLDCMHSI